MKKIIIALSLAMAAVLPMALPASAQTQTEEGTSAEMPWYVPISYAGYNFEIPAGSIVEKGSSVLVKYPDGSFGVSMSNTEQAVPNQKAAFLTCRRLGEQLHLENMEVKKETYAGVKGAVARGTLEGQKVTIMILPLNSEQVTTVIMATPDRQSWVDHFLHSLSR